MFMRILTWWSAWSDSNRQGLRRRILSAVCLAISSHADIYLKPTSYLIAISSISSWMMFTYDVLSRQKIYVAKAYPNTQHNA